MNRTSILPALALVIGLGSAIPVVAQTPGSREVSRPLTLPVQGNLPSLGAATDWLNSAPVDAARLRGKVVLVNFWTYSCINSLRQIPYVRAWADKYKEQGLVVVGVHAPEFAFERNVDNVRRATQQLGVGYPVAIDNQHGVWQAFDNQYWPALYFIDAQGHIRHSKFGEGDYAESERVIQQLLSEAGAKNVSQELVSVTAQGPEAAADWDDQRSPETYVGYERTERFSSPQGVQPDEVQAYSSPDRLSLNHWALAGNWTMGEQATVLHKAGGHVVYRFHARDLHMVMGPSTTGAPVKFRVTIDGKPPGDGHGVDVDSTGAGTVSQPRMYQLIRQSGPVVDRQFDIEFLDPGVEVFAITFG